LDLRGSFGRIVRDPKKRDKESQETGNLPLTSWLLIAADRYRYR
jgi:hypothetical protein